MNQHPMMTRLKCKSIPVQEQIDIPINNPPPENNDEDEEIDEHGNIKGFIDYSYDKKSKNKKRKKNKTKMNISDFIKIMMEQHYRKSAPQQLYILSSPKKNDHKEDSDEDIVSMDKEYFDYQ